jgi:hypothetical protein
MGPEATGWPHVQVEGAVQVLSLRSPRCVVTWALGVTCAQALSVICAQALKGCVHKFRMCEVTYMACTQHSCDNFDFNMPGLQAAGVQVPDLAAGLMVYN